MRWRLLRSARHWKRKYGICPSPERQTAFRQPTARLSSLQHRNGAPELGPYFDVIVTNDLWGNNVIPQARESLTKNGGHSYYQCLLGTTEDVRHYGAAKMADQEH